MLALLLAVGSVAVDSLLLDTSVTTEANNKYCLPGYRREVDTDAGTVTCKHIDVVPPSVMVRGVCIDSDYTAEKGGLCMKKCPDEYADDAYEPTAHAQIRKLNSTVKTEFCEVCADSLPSDDAVVCIADIERVPECAFYAPNTGFCTECSKGFVLHEVLTGGAVTSYECIAEGQFTDAETNKYCMIVKAAETETLETALAPKCAKCSREHILYEGLCKRAQVFGCALTDGEKTCELCLEGFTMKESGKYCESKRCDPGKFYDETTGECKDCDPSFTCFGNATNHIGCKPGFFDAHEATINTSTGLPDLKCVKCLDNCQECSKLEEVTIANDEAWLGDGSQTTCTLCDSGFALFKGKKPNQDNCTNVASEAIKYCEDMEVDNKSAPFCLKCNQNVAETVDGVALTGQSTFLYGGKCYLIGDCELDSYYVDYVTAGEVAIQNKIQCLGYLQNSFCTPVESVAADSYILGSCEACQAECLPGHCYQQKIDTTDYVSCQKDCNITSFYGMYGVDKVCSNDYPCKKGYYSVKTKLITGRCLKNIDDCAEHYIPADPAEPDTFSDPVQEPVTDAEIHKCKKCNVGFYATDQTCEKCADHCNNCTSKTVCTVAADGYYLSSTDNTYTTCENADSCKPVQCDDTSCKTCKNGADQCLECQAGYAKERVYGEVVNEKQPAKCVQITSTATDCTAPISGCTSCEVHSSYPACSICDKDSYFYKGLCIKIEGCNNNYVMSTSDVVINSVETPVTYVSCNCPTGTYLGKAEGTENPACVKCGNGCKSCTGNGNLVEKDYVYVNTASLCDAYACEDTYIYDNQSLKCVKEPLNCEYNIEDLDSKCGACFPGFGKQDTGAHDCVPCAMPGCSECTVDASDTVVKCTNCFQRYDLSGEDADAKCVLKCNSSQYRDGDVCKPCKAGATACKLEADGDGVNKLYDTACKDGYYLEPDATGTGDCANSACSMCKKCGKGYILCSDADACFEEPVGACKEDTCQPGYTLENKKCVACAPGCKSCTAAGKCDATDNTGCFEGYFHSETHPETGGAGNTCYKQCPAIANVSDLSTATYYFHPLNKPQFCTPCPKSLKGCNQCATATTCTANGCAAGHVINLDTKQCVKAEVKVKITGRVESKIQLSRTNLYLLIASIVVSLGVIIGIAVGTMKVKRAAPLRG